MTTICTKRKLRTRLTSLIPSFDSNLKSLVADEFYGLWIQFYLCRTSLSTFDPENFGASKTDSRWNIMFWNAVGL